MRIRHSSGRFATLTRPSIKEACCPLGCKKEQVMWDKGIFGHMYSSHKWTKKKFEKWAKKYYII